MVARVLGVIEFLEEISLAIFLVLSSVHKDF
jgi:hypothetical protein